jgi:putative transposase
MKKGQGDFCGRYCQKQLNRKQSEVNFLAAFVKRFPFHLSYRRMPSAEEKIELLAFIHNFEELPLPRKLCLISLSKSRFYNWQKMQNHDDCLEDYSSCPKRSPNRLTFQEISEIRTLVQRADLYQMSLTSLYWYGRRQKMIHLSVLTWFKYIHKHKMLDGLEKRRWHRPNKLGLKADRPNQIWHIDVTQFKLASGKRVYLQVILDNYSRFVIAWRLFDKVNGLGTKNLIKVAKEKFMAENKVHLVSDGGTENVNRVVREYATSSLIKHEVAQIDIDFSNSMIEAFFKGFKQYCVYKNELTEYSFALEAISQYIEKYNNQIPRHIFQGMTPVERFGNKITFQILNEQVVQGSIEARLKRMAQNRTSCSSVCYRKIA